MKITIKHIERDLKEAQRLLEKLDDSKEEMKLVKGLLTRIEYDLLELSNNVHTIEEILETQKQKHRG